MTIFYNEQYATPFAIPLLAFELLANLQRQGDSEAVYKVLRDCCGIEHPTESDYAYFVARISEVASKQEATEPLFKPYRFGKALDNLLENLKVENILLIACGYNYEQAKLLYCRVDREIAMAVVQTWVKVESHRHNMMLESVLYGNGGKYKDDGGAQSKVIELDKLSAEESMAAMQALFG